MTSEGVKVHTSEPEGEREDSNLRGGALNTILFIVSNKYDTMVVVSRTLIHPPLDPLGGLSIYNLIRKRYNPSKRRVKWKRNCDIT